jgi:hypothetical protein
VSCSCGICEHQAAMIEIQREHDRFIDGLRARYMGVIEDQRDTNAYVAPALSMENAKEAIAAWTHKDQETLYRWLHGAFKCRM